MHSFAPVALSCLIPLRSLQQALLHSSYLNYYFFANILIDLNYLSLIKPVRLMKIVPPLIRNNPLPGPRILKITIKMRMSKSPNLHTRTRPALLIRKIRRKARRKRTLPVLRINSLRCRCRTIMRENNDLPMWFLLFD